MARNAFVISEEHHPLSVRRDVRKPVIEIIMRNLLLLAPIGMHAPDLHVPGALGIEINKFPVRRIFWPVVQSLGGGPPRLLAARRRNRIDIKIARRLARGTPGPCRPRASRARTKVISPWFAGASRP